MYSLTRNLFVVATALFISFVSADSEEHTISFVNKCGKGTTTISLDGNVVTTGPTTISAGPFSGFRAYLQQGDCDTDGSGCPYVQATLDNEGLSHAAIFLLPGAKFTAPIGYKFYGSDGSCDGKGQDCTMPHCPEAVTNPTSPGGGIPIHFAGANCTAPNINLEVRFCD